MGDPSPEADPDAIDLRILVAHAHSVAAATTVETARGFFAQHDIDFIAVLSEGRLIRACARRDLVASLGSRYGFALDAHRPVAEHLMSHPLRIGAGSAITEVFQKAAARDSRDFYDDVLLVDAEGTTDVPFASVA